MRTLINPIRPINKEDPVVTPTCGGNSVCNSTCSADPNCICEALNCGCDKNCLCPVT